MTEITQGEIITKWQEICEQPDTYGEGVISAVRLARWIERQAAPTLAAEVARLNIKLAYNGDEVTRLKADLARKEEYTKIIDKNHDELAEFAKRVSAENKQLKAQVEAIRENNERLRVALTNLVEFSIGRYASGGEKLPTIAAARAALGGER